MDFFCICRFSRLGQPFSVVWVTKLQSWVDAWDEADEHVVQLSVFVTGNKIYMVGHRITSLMVAQDARNETRGLDRFGPSGGGNTLRPVCGCIIPMLRCALGLLEAMVG